MSADADQDDGSIVVRFTPGALAALDQLLNPPGYPVSETQIEAARRAVAIAVEQHRKGTPT
jgi:hypothetical protein